MRILGLEIRRNRPVEARSVEVAQSASNFLELIGVTGTSAAGITVTTENALGIPAIFAAVNFIPGTLAGLPLNLYKRTDAGRERVTDTPLARLLHDAVNDETSSFEWRKHMFEQVMTGGRGLTFIERDSAKRPMNFWALDPTKTTIKRINGRKIYEYREAGQKIKKYEANEIIDIPFMLKADGLSHRGPISTNRDVIALGIAATNFGSKFFDNGGIPPFAVTGPFQSGGALGRAAEDFQVAVRKAANEKRQALVMPSGFEVKSLGADAAKSQLVELKRFLVEEYARIYSLPPNFVQDLTNGTFSNTEQQDLHLVKHCIKRWVEAFEQETNLKLFGRDNREFFVEMNMDGLLRGDFVTRMEGYAKAIQNGTMTPNEARRMENRPDDAAGNVLMIQGATVPISHQLSAPTDKGAGNGA